MSLRGTQASTSGTWTPTFNALTVVLGGGSVAYTGTWVKAGNLVYWTANVTPAGGATTACTAGTTTITNLPFASAVNTTCAATDGNVNSRGIGLVDASTAYPPTWAAYGGPVIISGVLGM